MFEMTINNRVFFWRTIASDSSKLTPWKMKILHFTPLSYQKFGLLVMWPLGYEGFVEEFQE